MNFRWMHRSYFLVGMVLMAGLLLTACQSTNRVPTEAAPVGKVAPTAALETEAAPSEAATSGDVAAVTAASAGNSIPFRFTNGGAEARFLIDEVLMGQNKTVVGATTQVEGELAVDPGNPSAVQVGVIRIDASDFTTDDSRRTNRVRNDILKSSQEAYRYITFTPTSITGLPATATPGDSFTFQVTGDLKILDTTLPVTFDMSVTVVDDATLQGSGRATIRYADFGIRIPQVPMVASVSDDVKLEIDFTAQAGG
ncbi:MAG TPA: YceI family protein [Chloroflexi bacterium]|nr:YceI family protein [Chloroflexota bacterium]